jgi:hypothetical protein
MINENLTRDYEPVYNLIEYEEGGSISIVFNYRNGLGPLSKVVYSHNNVLMPPNQSWVATHKVHPPLGEETDSNDWMERGWMRAHFLSEHLAGVTLLNRFNAIFKDRRQKIIGLQNFLGCRKPR